MLKSKRKSLGVVFCGLLVFFCIIASFGFQAIFNASASEQEYFSAERYTDNGYVIKRRRK